MKTKIIILAAVMLFAFRLDAKPFQGISIGMFYSSLQPYGDWIQLDAGVTVWRPYNIAVNWRPYSIGRWYWSDYGWYWDSDEPFGWATYHYGRWYDDDYYGWIWIPDDQWGPSWVEWRYNDDYIGWAPLPPYASFQINLGIHFSIGWHSGYRYWNFVNYNHFCNHRVHAYLIDNYRAERIFNTTRYRTNYYSDHNRIINGGIDRSFVERRTGARIDERRIREVNDLNDFNRYRSERGERGDRVVAYRPNRDEVSREHEMNNFDIRRGESRSSLQRDKIFMRGENQPSRNMQPERNRVENQINAQRQERSIQPERNQNYNPSWRSNNNNNRVQREVITGKPQNIERSPSRSYESQQYQPRESAPRREQINRSEGRTERPRSESRERSNSNRGNAERRR